MARQDTQVVSLNSLADHPMIHLIFGNPLLPSEFVAEYLCEPLELCLAGEVVSA